MAKSSYSGSYEQTMVKLEQMAQATNAQQMQWQEKMSKTSHQMEVADLVAAGLNPVLSSGGSGAQSYTTSLDSAASAVGNLASAHESASATRYAAQQSAAATRAAAAANLAAAREAAAASRYAADKGLEGTKYQTDHSKSGTLPGILSNVFNKYLSDDVPKEVKDIAAGILKGTSKSKTYDNILRNNADNVKKLQWQNFNNNGHFKIKDEMKKFNIKWSMANANLYIDAFYNHNERSMQKWTALVNNNYRSRKNAARNLMSFNGMR